MLIEVLSTDFLRNGYVPKRRRDPRRHRSPRPAPVPSPRPNPAPGVQPAAADVPAPPVAAAAEFRPRYLKVSSVNVFTPRNSLATGLGRVPVHYPNIRYPGDTFHYPDVARFAR